MVKTMIENQTNCIKVIESVFLNQKYIVVAQLISGEIEGGSILVSKETGIKFIIKGIGFIPAEAYEKGKRAITLIPYDSRLEHNLKVGEVLYKEENEI